MKAITTKFHGPTNTRGSRYSATDSDGNRVSLATEFELDSTGNHERAAKALCVKMGWVQYPLMGGGTKNGCVFVFDAHHNRTRFSEEEIEAGRANDRKPKVKVA